MKTTEDAKTLIEKLCSAAFRPVLLHEARVFVSRARRYSYESWASEFLQQCGASKDAGNTSDSLVACHTAVSLLVEFLMPRPKILLKNVHLQRMISVENTEERLDLAKRTIQQFFTLLKHELTSKARDTDGTFANAYRRVQLILSRSADARWCAYGGQFYGPAGLGAESPKLDYQQQAFAIALPADAPDHKHLFTEKSIRPLAEYFHAHLCQALGLKPECRVSIRCLVYWLCGKYEIIDRPVTSATDDAGDGYTAVDMLPAPASSQWENTQRIEAQKRVQYAANAVALRLSAKQQCLYALLYMEEATLEEAAAVIGLRGASGVHYQKEALHERIRQAMLQHEELSADDNGSIYFQTIFFDHLGSICKQALEARKQG